MARGMFFGVFVAMLLFSPAFGAEGGLVIRIVTRVMKVKEQAEPKAFYSIQLINLGDKEVTVLSRISDYDAQYSPADAPATDLESKVYKIQFGLTGSMKTADGYLIIPSLTDYKPVTLRKNECVVLEKPQPLPGSSMKFLDSDLLKRMKTMEISYFVSEEMGERLGIWHGRVTAKYAVEDGIIQGETLKRKTN